MEFDANISVMERIGDQLTNVEQILSSCENDLSEVGKVLWKINDPAIRIAVNKLSGYNSYMQSQNNKLHSYRSVLLQISGLYKNTENGILGSGVVKAEIAQSKDGHDSQAVDLMKFFLTLFDKTNADDRAGVTKDFLSYIEALYKFFTGDMKGATGARDVFNLGDKSIGLWNGFYEYLDNFYQGKGDLFSEPMQSAVKWLGIVGSIYGMTGTAFEVCDSILKGDKGPAGIIGEIVGGGGSIVDIWDSYERWKYVGEELPNITTKTGLYSPLSYYTATIKGGLAFISQGFSSYETYMEDGKWDLNDTSRTGVESSVAGLYAMADSMSFGMLKYTGIKPEDISSGLENWAGGAGTDAGNYIVNHRELYDAYQNSGTIGKVAITFYSWHASVWDSIF